MEWVGRREEEGRGIEKEKTKVDTVSLLSKPEDCCNALLECCFLLSYIEALPAGLQIRQPASSDNQTESDKNTILWCSLQACSLVLWGKVAATANFDGVLGCNIFAFKVITL